MNGSLIHRFSLLCNLHCWKLGFPKKYSFTTMPWQGWRAREKKETTKSEKLQRVMHKYTHKVDSARMTNDLM